MAKSTEGKGPKEITIEGYKQIMLAVVHASAMGLSEVLKNYKSEAERTSFIRTYANKIRIFPDQTGYIFVLNLDGVNVALPTINEWQGKDFYDHKDSHGKYVIRELLAAAKKGGGFVEYYWAKPGATGEHKKLGYVESIPGTNYLIGTGVYIKD
jgi:signal transduction histidine kinase